MAEKITNSLKADHPDVRIDGVDSVSGKVSEELFSKGILALACGDGRGFDLYLVPVSNGSSVSARSGRWCTT